MTVSNPYSRLGVIRKLAIVAVLAAMPVRAWDGATTGIINTMDVTASGNYALRITLHGVGTMCTGGASWAWLNETDSNYKSYAAALLMAKAQGLQVTLYTTLEYGHCRIGYIVLY